MSDETLPNPKGPVIPRPAAVPPTPTSVLPVPATPRVTPEGLSAVTVAPRPAVVPPTPTSVLPVADTPRTVQAAPVSQLQQIIESEVEPGTNGEPAAANTTVISALPEIQTQEQVEAEPELAPERQPRSPKWLSGRMQQKAKGSPRTSSKMPLLLAGGAGLLLLAGALMMRPRHEAEVPMTLPPGSTTPPVKVKTTPAVTPAVSPATEEEGAQKTAPPTPTVSAAQSIPVHPIGNVAQAEPAPAATRPAVQAALVAPDPSVAGAFTGGHNTGNAQNPKVQSAETSGLAKGDADIVTQVQPQETPNVLPTVQTISIPRAPATPAVAKVTPTPASTPQVTAIQASTPQNVPVVVTPAPSKAPTQGRDPEIEVYSVPTNAQPIVLSTQTPPQPMPIVVRVPQTQVAPAKVQSVPMPQEVMTPQPVVVRPAPVVVTPPAEQGGAAGRAAAPEITSHAQAMPGTVQAKSTSGVGRAAQRAEVPVTVTPLVEYLGYVASDEEKTAILRVGGRDEIGVAGQDIPGTDIYIRAVTPTSLTIETEAVTKTVPLTEKP